MKKRILIISYFYPPNREIASVRIYNFVYWLLQYGWKVYLLKPCNYEYINKDDFLQNIDSDNLKIYNIPTIPIRKILLSLFNFIFGNRRKKKSINIKDEKSNSNKEFLLGKVKIVFRKLYYTFPFNLLNRGGLLYIISAFLTGFFIINKYGIGNILSSYGPYTSAVIGYLLKKTSGSAKWILDFRDLPTGDNIEDYYFKNLQEKINTNFIKTSNIITTVSDGLKENLLLFEKPVYTIRNGISKSIESIDSNTQTDKFTITYTGNLYLLKRDPSLLFQTICELLKNEKVYQDDVLLKYAGSSGDIWDNIVRQYGLSEKSINYGYITREKALKLQSETTINLLLTWSEEHSKGIITGKFYEYIATRKPLICLLNGVQDEEIEDIIKRLNIGKVFYDDVAELTNYIEKLYNEWKATKSIQININNKFLDTFKYENIVKQLDGIISSNK